MTRQSDVDRVLDLWLEEGPLRVPDHVFDDAIGRLRRQPQRAAWRLRWRNVTVITPLRVAAATIAIVAVAGVGLAYFGSNPNVGPPVSESPPPSASATVSAPPTDTPRPIQCEEDGPPGDPCLGRLEPGTYTATDPLVPFSFTVPAGWQNPMNILGGATIERQDNGTGAAIFVWPDPVIADQTTCQKAPESSRGRTVDDIVAFLTSEPGLETSSPEPVTIGGLAGQRLNLATTAPPDEPCGTAVTLFVHDGTIEDEFWWDLDTTRQMNVYVLDAGDGHTVLVNVEAPNAIFDQFVTEATPIVNSFDFAP